MTFLLVYYKDIFKEDNSSIKFVVYSNAKFREWKEMCRIIKDIHKTSFCIRHDSHFDKKYILEQYTIRDIDKPLQRVIGHFTWSGNHSEMDTLFHLNSHLRRIVKDTGLLQSLNEDEFTINLDDTASSGKRTRIRKMIDLYFERNKDKIRESPSEVLNKLNYELKELSNGELTLEDIKMNNQIKEIEQKVTEVTSDIKQESAKMINDKQRGGEVSIVNDEEVISVEELRRDYKSLLRSTKPVHEKSNRLVILEDDDLLLLYHYSKGNNISKPTKNLRPETYHLYGETTISYQIIIVR